MVHRNRFTTKRYDKKRMFCLRIMILHEILIPKPVMMKHLMVGTLLAMFIAFPLLAQSGFDADLTEPPATHPAVTPEDGDTVSVNPPPMIWRVDDRAASYTLEIARDNAFADGAIRVEGLDMPFYNHSAVLQEGTWYWRYYVVTENGDRSRPTPARRFSIDGEAVDMPVPSTEQILSDMPSHPRIFTTPEQLAFFRAQRHGPAREAWANVQWRANQELGVEPVRPAPLIPLREQEPRGPTPGMEGVWQEGEDVRRQVIWLVDGEPAWTDSYTGPDLNRDAGRANILSFAYLILGERKYAEAAKEWLMLIADARVDYHLDDRAQHDTVVYNYENGLKYVALAFDRIYDHLSPEERERVLDHIEYHGEAAYQWLRDRTVIHLDYQQSHPQQCMHALLTTTLAVATHREAFREWTDYLVRQYVNRIAWTSEDGGYFEGQTYAHKFRWILEGLAAMRTATGIDLFQQPRIRNSGRFWLYAMSLNYWYHHGGDIYSLLWPWGNSADAYITNLLASMNDDPYLQWWSNTVFANPEHVPFQYLSGTELEPKPPIDLPQAAVFPQTGQVAAFDRLYDHQSDRIFFRSSRWGSHSHSHSDQNSFVIHSGGEIMAADPGYYTYYGDDYHTRWSAATFTHNTLLVNGKGQPPGIDASGEITNFFHSPSFTLFSGDASQAYGEPLERFNREVLFIRPGFYVVYDELRAGEPTEFTWLLNSFQEADIDQGEQKIVVPQQDRRLSVRHLQPSAVRYEQNNERPYPIQTRAWARVTEAFPEPWLIRARTEPVQETRFLTLMSTYDADEGDTVRSSDVLENETTSGVHFNTGMESHTVLFRNDSAEASDLTGNGLATDGRVATITHGSDDEVQRWMIAEGTHLADRGETLLEMEQPGDVSLEVDAPGARVLARIRSEDPQQMTLSMGNFAPTQVFTTLPENPDEIREIPHSWNGEHLTIEWPGGEALLWVDPKRPVSEPLSTPPLLLSDGEGTVELEMRTAASEDGMLVAYAELDPMDAGRYHVEAESAEEILIQDRWDPAVTSRGRDRAEGVLRNGTELFVHFSPEQPPEAIHGRLADSFSGEVNNLLRNGGFEEGIPDYPPRGWTVMPTRPHVDDEGVIDFSWPEWSQKDATEGISALRFYRQEKAMGLRSQPMRLPADGTYRLRFMARGNATHAEVSVHGSRDTGDQISVKPTEEWTLYEVDLDLAAGYTEIRIRMDEGGEADQVLWVDEMEFGPVGR